MNADSLACWVEGGNLCERDLFRKVIPIKMGAGGHRMMLHGSH